MFASSWFSQRILGGVWLVGVSEKCVNMASCLRAQQCVGERREALYSCVCVCVCVCSNSGMHSPAATGDTDPVFNSEVNCLRSHDPVRAEWSHGRKSPGPCLPTNRPQVRA